MRNALKKTLLAAAALLIATPAFAETVAIVNARVETVSAAGPIASGSVVIKDGKIVAVGANVAVPAGARVVDAHGGVVTPGMIAPSSSISVAEVDGLRETRDDRAGQYVSAGFDVQYGVNPASALIPLARQTGMTRAVVTPILGRGGFGEDEETRTADYTAGGDDSGRDPGLFAGQAAIVRLTTGDPNPVVRARVAVALDMGQDGARNAGGGRGASIVLIKAAFADARSYAANRAAYERGQTRSYAMSKVDLEALVPVVQGKVPLLIRVHRASDILQVIRLAQEEHVTVIIEGAEEGWMVAPDLARAGIPVIIDSEADLPRDFETLGSRLDNATRLQAAGVLVSITGARDFTNLRQERFNAGTAVANGLPYQAALASVTLNPAKIWGMADRVGSIEVGKDADLVIWSGDPLELASWPVSVFIGGVEQPNTSRGLQLRDRYMHPADGMPPAYH
ncbi:MAG: amidohydrolase [Caulobacter sp.]|nr:amidohydrolase [Caulobacter sp.]